MESSDTIKPLDFFAYSYAEPIRTRRTCSRNLAPLLVLS
ncbi:hypothetical protein CHELA40_12409 [Chelatococcus asaccharovorans]|nr:hypothetical protein CHELA40_12409 [Chelatococcus asaccharovorans]CAH1682750.1 hypothetical protein CHELA17_63198 [Chelatococcus asaccharovorans]